MLKNLYKSIFFLFLTLLFFIFVFLAPDTLAQNINSSKISASTSSTYFLRINKETAKKGYVVSFHDLKISIGTSTLNDESGLSISEIPVGMPIPWQMNKISQVYQFEFLNKKSFAAKQAFTFEFKYKRSSNFFKQVYFFDRGTWRVLPSLDFPDKQIVRAKINLPFSRLVILENPRLMTIGQATWYSYKKGLFAASPDFPAGSKLRVYNLAYGKQKFVDVTINDYGPNRLVHPNRAIDLDKVAFAKIAKTEDGAANILIEPLSLPADFKIRENLGDIKAETTPQVSAKSAYLFSENKGTVIFEKNSKAVLPLASLSKIVAAKVFLDTAPDLKRIVNYSLVDEEKNYQYCKKWESSKLNLEDNDRISIEDLLISSLSASTNNTVETLVRVSGVKRSDFINKMNDFTKATGASSTIFIEPTGLSPKNVSSVKEYAIIFNEAIENKIISASATKTSYKILINNGEKKISIYNTDKILGLNKYHIIASKTGYLDEVGYNLTIKAEQNGKKLILVMMGASTREQTVMDALKLLEFGFKH